MIISDPINIEEILSPSISNIKEDFKVKIVLLGDSGVGKTNLISRFTKKLEIKCIRGCYPNNLFLYICFHELHSKPRRL